MAAEWRPAATLARLRERATALQRIRAFFEAREVLEVETPILGSTAVTEPNLASIPAACHVADSETRHWLWLQTSPEYPMKRLLAAGSGSVYQMARVFRDGERGPLHNPEFSLLEWYRPGFGYRDLIAEVGELLALLLPRRPVVAIRYADAFQQQLGLDPLTATPTELLAVADTHGLAPPRELARDEILDLLMATLIAPGLGRDCWCFITHFPASQAALARLDPADERTAERFECFIDGVEIANGFRELADAAEQRRRFHADRAQRRARGESHPPAPDERLLAALAAGLPDCSGVAVGLDRLLMIALGAPSVDDVIAFPIERA